MKIIQLSGTLLERTQAENQAAEAVKLEAQKDYNEMMGIWLDPSEEEVEPDGEV